MKLDQFIKYKMIDLNRKYDMSLIEIKKIVDEDKLIKTYIFNYKARNGAKKKNQSRTFKNKKALVSWLICLE